MSTTQTIRLDHMWKIGLLLLVSASIHQCSLEFPRELDENLDSEQFNVPQIDFIKHNLQKANVYKHVLGGQVPLPSSFSNSAKTESLVSPAGNPNGRGVTKAKKSQLLVFAVDGFRYDYPKIVPTPNLNLIAKRGMFASFGLIPIFSTKTFPNFYSIATGLYQESHGIVDNRFYDPKWNATFSIHDPVTRSESRWFEQGEPIWKTAILQGKRVGTFFWPGSDIAHQGVRPTFWRAYDSSIKFKERVDTVVGWLRNEQLDMAMMYVNEPDHVAHLTGPFSEQTKQKIEQLDQMIGYMLGKLKTYGLMDSVDILILSDHGMSGPAELNNRIALSDYIYLKGNIKSVPTTGSVVHIEPMPGKENEVYRRLNNAHPHMKVYRKKDLPDRWHFKNNSRIMPIVAVADEGYVISKFPMSSEKYVGHHGYDNQLDSMKPIFYGIGPKLVAGGHQVQPFETINLYNLMCRLLMIRPADNNGTMSLIEPLLVENTLKNLGLNQSKPVQADTVPVPQPQPQPQQQQPALDWAGLRHRLNSSNA